MTPLILDPALFMDPVPGVTGSAARSAAQVRNSLDDCARAVVAANGVISDDVYWKNIERRLLAPMLAAHRADPQIRQAIALIRKRVQKLPTTSVPSATVWSFKNLLSCLGSDWLGLALRAAADLVGAGHLNLAMVVRPVAGRNLVVHGAPPGAVQEKSVWTLRMLAAGNFARIHCIANERNVAVPWTCRYDDRLPAVLDRAPFPFCAPPLWYLAQPAPMGRAVRTGAHPGSEDMSLRIWTRPSGRRGLDHWDVQIPAADQKKVGNPYLNITIGWPLKPGSKPPGTIDHGHVPPFTKWRC
ncbi:MAG: hypothetical protein H6704_30590 [Myxococcales bacterium]|nr:hypothetical protein [Myxococcales bacterium]MCB9610825.1 hypothetical protein [Polyangiaceae bacterium]